MNFLTTYKNYIIIGIVISMLTIILIESIYIKLQSGKINFLQEKITEIKLDLSNEKANNTTLRSSIKDQNQKIEELKDLLEDFEDVSKANKEWQDNFTNALLEIKRTRKIIKRKAVKNF